MRTKPRLYVLTNNHFDLTWRRCWNRRFQWRGDEFVSYAELEDYYLTDNLALACRHPEYKFEAESTAVLRQFVRRHPERLAELRQLAQAGRFRVTGGGDNIVDANLVLGESLVRNFLTGLLWVEENLGVPTRVGVRNDAFGNSAQLPQILRGCELPWVTGISYSPIKKPYWRGLDGSTVCVANLPLHGSGGGWNKYPPCPQCRGRGCRGCQQRGIELKGRASLPGEVAEPATGYVIIQPEEYLPNPAIFAWARRHRARFDVRFAVQEDFLPHLAEQLAKVDNPSADQLHPSVEANPNNAGCWVARIKLKQHCRRQEYALLDAEKLACLAGNRALRRPLRAIWEQLLFTMFHDAITATHVDAAHDELLDVIADIDRRIERVRAAAVRVKRQRGVISVLNLQGHPVTEVVDGRVRRLPAWGAKSFPLSRPPRPKPVARSVIENERFRITADEHGLTAIHDKQWRRALATPNQWRPNELILEHDEGSPWATLSPCRDRLGLARETRLEVAEATPHCQRLIFTAAPARAGNVSDGLKVRSIVTLWKGLPRVDFVVEASWDTYNHRLRVAMPLRFTGRGVFGIPYGQIERQPYTPTYHWAGANGDWPAINWAGIEGPQQSVALLNKGLPSYAHEGDCLFLSLLRSPAVPTYLHEPRSYEMTGFDGMRDAGQHRFEYALRAYDCPFAESSVVTDAESYNAGLLAVPGRVRLPAAPRVQSENVRLAAWKWAEQGRGMILRLAEYRGRPGTAMVKLPGVVGQVQKTNLLERRGQPLPLRSGRVSISVRAWELVTLRVE